jgi:MtN3 and saliva related transmembrane protein
MSSDKWLNLLGLGGGTLMSIMMIPQLWQVYKTKSAKDLAWGFLINYFVGISMLCSFSFGKGLWSLYIPQSLEVVMVLFQILMKLRYDRRAIIGNEENALESIVIDNRVHIAPRATATQVGTASIYFRIA